MLNTRACQRMRVYCLSAVVLYSSYVELEKLRHQILESDLMPALTQFKACLWPSHHPASQNCNEMQLNIVGLYFMSACIHQMQEQDAPSLVIRVGRLLIVWLRTKSIRRKRTRAQHTGEALTHIINTILQSTTAQILTSQQWAQYQWTANIFHTFLTTAQIQSLSLETDSADHGKATAQHAIAAKMLNGRACLQIVMLVQTRSISPGGTDSTSTSSRRAKLLSKVRCHVRTQCP